MEQSPGKAATPGAFRRLALRPELLGAIALGCVYLAVMSGHSYSIDGVLMYRQAVSIVQDHSLRFATPIFWGDVYTSSKYGIGLSLLYLPGVSLSSLAGLSIPTPQPGVYDWNLFYRDSVYALGAAPVDSVLTAAAAYLVARCVRALGFGSGPALVGLAGFGIASPALVYARGDFAQPLLGFCIVAGVLAALRYRQTARMSALVTAGACLCLAVLTRPFEGSFLLPALIALVVQGLRPSRWGSGSYRAMAVIAVAYAIAVSLTLLVNWGRFGSPLQTGYSAISWGTPLWIGLPGVLISPSRGIVWQMPLIVLTPLGLLTLWRRGQRLVAGVTGGLAGALLINTALWVPWWGAQSWGARLFVPALPLVAITAAAGSVSLRGDLRRWLVPVLLTGGLLWALPGAVTNLLGGYAARYDGSIQSFALSGYPPVGAWRYLHHVWALGPDDPNSVDIVWFRIARTTDYASLAVPAVLLVLACLLAVMASRLIRDQAAEAAGLRQATRQEPTPGRAVPRTPG